jgi:hypothetical protein
MQEDAQLLFVWSLKDLDTERKGKHSMNTYSISGDCLDGPSAIHSMSYNKMQALASFCGELPMNPVFNLSSLGHLDVSCFCAIWMG